MWSQCECLLVTQRHTKVMSSHRVMLVMYTHRCNTNQCQVFPCCRCSLYFEYTRIQNTCYQMYLQTRHFQTHTHTFVDNLILYELVFK